MFYGVEKYLLEKKYSIYILSVAILISIDFYLFWPTSILLLFYWLYRNLIIFKINKSNFTIFIKNSIVLLFYTIIGLLISSVFWLPGMMHLLSSARIGNYLFSYTNWSLINITSFFVFSFIPVLKYLNGFLKDSWYYFYQIGLYYGSIFLILIPHVFYVFESKKERIVNSIFILLIYSLLLSPKIGLFFHFTYSLRYTFVITFFGLIIGIQILDKLHKLNKFILLIVQMVIAIAYIYLTNVIIPEIYGFNMSINTTELIILKYIFILTIIYTTILLFINSNLKRPNLINALSIVLIFFSLIELYISTDFSIKSQDFLIENETPPFVRDSNYLDALTFLKSTDTTFYRIYQDDLSISNINLVYDFKSISTYDSTYQYSLIKYLDWTRQYPYTNWEFKYQEPSFNLIMDTRYAIC